MSDTEGTAAPTEVAAPAVPEPAAPEPVAPAPAAPEPVPPEPVPLEPAQVLSKHDRVKQIRERITAARSEAPPRNPDGTFKSAADTPVADTETDTAAPKVAESGQGEPEKLVTIPLDPSHPLWDQGIRELKDVPAHLEREVRTMANAVIRKSEAEAAQKAAQAAQKEAALLRAKMEMLQDGTLQNLDANPEVQALLADIERAYPEQAEVAQAAFAALQAQKRQAKEAELNSKVEREFVGRSFITEVQANATRQYPVWAQSGELAPKMQNAMAQYGDYVDARNANLTALGKPESQPSVKEFFNWVDSNYVRDPRVQKQLAEFQGSHTKKVSESAATKAAAAERSRIAQMEKQRLSEAAQRHSTRPPAPVPAGVRGAVVGDRGAQQSPAATHHGTRQRDLRAQVRARLAQKGP